MPVFSRRTVFSVFVVLWSALVYFPFPADPAPAGQEAASPVWPLDIPSRYLTSNFMEYRSGRFHAGLDLKTNSETGYVVRAVEDGYIARVRATPFAYGRAVYLRGESGRTFVYAHLMRFNDSLRRRVRERQDETGIYRVRLSFRPGEIPVRKGDIIGLSGQSGTEGPHLHFEVRDHKGRPVNPLDHGFAVTDTFPPVIHTLTAWPATPEARVGGSDRRCTLSAPEPGGLAGELPLLTVSGPVAFSACIIDAADIKGHRLEPWLIEVSLDGKKVYSCRNEKYAFGQNSMQRLEWVNPGIWGATGRREHWLFRRAGDDLVGREGGAWHLGEKGAGLAPGRHSLVISASDHEGNRVRVHLPIAVTREQGSPAPGWQAAPADSLAGNRIRISPFFLQPPDAPAQARVLTFRPEAGDPVLAPVTVLMVEESMDGFPGEIPPELKPVGQAVWYVAGDWAINSDLVVPFPGVAALGDSVASLGNGRSDPRLGVYRLGRRLSWELVGPLGPPRPGREASFSLSDPGLHAVFLDTAPPVFSCDSLVTVSTQGKAGYPGLSLPRWEVIPLGLVDSGAGVAPETIRAVLDGAPLVVEPDLPRHRVLVELPDSLASGRHRLRLDAADKAGNSTSCSLSIDCR